MPHERLPKQTLYVEVSGKRPVRRHEQDGLIIWRILAGTRLGFHPSEMQSVMVDREVWRFNLELLLRNPQINEKQQSRVRGNYRTFTTTTVQKYAAMRFSNST